MIRTLRELFFTPVDNNRKRLFILVVAVAFIFMPQQLPNDWDLNTEGFWTDIPSTYQDDANIVYPPWGLILMLPYQLMQAEGARFFSVLVVGWLVMQKQWSLSKFFAIVLSPYFLWMMLKSNMDIFVFVLPILLWSAAAGTRWQSIGWGAALSLLLLKPQGAIFIWLYFFWTSRKNWKDLILPLLVVAVVTIPVSLIGSPPLLVQWLDNLANPSARNQLYWSMNNISLTSRYTLPGALLLLAVASLALFFLIKRKQLVWTNSHTLAALLFLSFFSLPYASQQSFSSALAFVPSWPAFAIQVAGILIASSLNVFIAIHPLLALSFAFCSLIFFVPPKVFRARTTATEGPVESPL